MEPTEFLNLDLELRSRSDLGPLTSLLERKISVLYSGEFEGEYQLTAEPRSGGHANQTAERCTEELLALIATLPNECRELFRSCHLRAFDYGFRGGLESPALSVDLPPGQLQRMSELGIGLRVTVYSYSAEPPVQVEESDA